MNHSFPWLRLSIVLLLLLMAACAKQETPEPQEPAMPAASMTDTIAVSIGSDGSFSQDTITPDPGDVVSFFADGTDAVLCVAPDSVFGEERYPIANGETLALQVQPTAVHVDFSFAACVGDLAATCGGCRGEEGGGRTGP